MPGDNMAEQGLNKEVDNMRAIVLEDVSAARMLLARSTSYLYSKI